MPFTADGSFHIYSRRSLMSLQIFILGILSEGEHHPYDLKKQVLKPLDNSFPINDGTLYYNFEVL